MTIIYMEVLCIMWNKSRSIKLSYILVKCVMGVMVILAIFIPYMVRWYDGISTGGGIIDTSVFVPLCVTLYLSWVVGMVCLVALNRLISNIDKDLVFITDNTKCLRVISWCCIVVGMFFAVFGLWRSLGFLVSFVALFFGLILRVLKNVFEEAVALKEENDYTI